MTGWVWLFKVEHHEVREGGRIPIKPTENLCNTTVQTESSTNIQQKMQTESQIQLEGTGMSNCYGNSVIS